MAFSSVDRGEMDSALEVFCCYARKDQPLLNQLRAHLMPLQRQGLIKIWADTDIGAGAEWEKEIEKRLNRAQIILLLISPDFMASEYCYSKEMQRAMERHKKEEARVIPIILRPTDWQGVLGHLQALPTEGRPITSWSNTDEAFINVIDGIRLVIKQLTPVHYKEYLKEIVQAYHKALEDACKFGYDVCPDCGSTNLIGGQLIDYANDEIYYIIRCEECGWEGEGELAAMRNIEDNFPF